MSKQKQYFDLSLDTLRVLSGWAADCAERALPIYEECNPGDRRPRDAIVGVRLFANGGPRTAKLRVLALDAYRASLEPKDAMTSAVARAASLAAASAYTHPFVDIDQAKHILGPAAHAALAIEIQNKNDPGAGDAEARRAFDQAGPEICELLRKMPRQKEGESRLDRIMFDLDSRLRNKYQNNS